MKLWAKSRKSRAGLRDLILRDYPAPDPSRKKLEEKNPVRNPAEDILPVSN
jgi:hypothetical protein